MQEAALSRETQVQEILKEVSEDHVITIDELTGPGRPEHVVLARKDAYKKLEQAGLGPCAIGMALNRDPSVVVRALAKETPMCPKGHGPLRRDREGFAVCTTCAYEEPPELPTGDTTRDSEPKGYKPKGGGAVRAGQGFRYPEKTKIQAVADVEQGADKEEVRKRVGCNVQTLDAWIAKYGKEQFATHINVLKRMLSEANDKRQIETLNQAIKILEEAKEK